MKGRDEDFTRLGKSVVARDGLVQRRPVDCTGF